jgi:vacuolar-type H+-ATPase subunit H
MPKEPSVSTTTTAEPAASASDRAREMRARLGAQRDAEEMLAEASQLRHAAAEEAGVIVAEAEALSEQLVTEAREAADKLATEAQERADGILARAYYEAEDLQRHTEEERARIRDEVQSAGRAEIEAFRARSAGLLDDAEHGLRELAPNLEDAVATVVGALRSLDELRNGPPAEPAADKKRAALAQSAAPEPVSDVDPEAEGDDDSVAMVAEGAPATRLDDTDARPLGWLFRASQA